MLANAHSAFKIQNPSPCHPARESPVTLLRPLEAHFVFSVEPLVGGFEFIHRPGIKHLARTHRQIQKLFQSLNPANP